MSASAAKLATKNAASATPASSRRAMTATSESAIEVSAKRGNLVGSPAPKDKGLEVRALLDPGIRPGRRVVVVSAQVRGTYSVQSVDYIGDSGWDASFYADFLGKEAA